MRILNTWDQLQTLIGQTETPDIDFKGAAYPEGDFEIGKDIVAFANTLGGSIVIGASTAAKTRCTGFHGIPSAEAAREAERIERVAKDFCRPTPFVIALPIELPTKPKSSVVVVSIGMSPAAPLGCNLKSAHNDAWLFPYRVGSQTKYLSPDQFGAFESMTARRIAALLMSIPEKEQKDVTLRWFVPNSNGLEVPNPNKKKEVRLEEVKIENNAASFCDASKIEGKWSIPLDEITTVWRDSAEGRWHVFLNGRISDKNPWDYCPR
jgi:predicted HTH transcriptional regulator